MQNNILSGTSLKNLRGHTDKDRILLYQRSDAKGIYTGGAAIYEKIISHKLLPSREAFDFLSLALSVLSADLLVSRKVSPDGWTREINISVPVSNSAKWMSLKDEIDSMLKFLTTDIWNVSFYQDAFFDDIKVSEKEYLEGNCVTLLSGGLDSLIGLIDLCQEGKKPLVISQIVAGDRLKQHQFTETIDSELQHIQLNHNITCTGENSTRSRSIIFFAYGIMMASCLKGYDGKKVINLYVCENGLISLNVPLTNTRIGSLSTRTTNPVYIGQLQGILDKLGLKIKIINPYQFKTKGEMCIACKDQRILSRLAKESTSCGRFARYGFTQCGRCIPCLIRRAAFKKWNARDNTGYHFKNLGRRDVDHANFDDVRSAALAIVESEEDLLDEWIGPALSHEVFLQKYADYRSLLRRSLDELKDLLISHRVL